MTFFKAIADDKKIDGVVHASALATLNQDKALLKNHKSHEKTSCAIM